MSSPSPAQTSRALLMEARTAQSRWAAASIRGRLRVIRRLRHLLAADPLPLARTVPLDIPGSLHRTVADTIVAEILPLAEACRWLIREAREILAPERLGVRSRPVWLRGVDAQVYREPLGLVLVVGPANYPLFLPGVQVLQALVAGNAVAWKPAPAGKLAAEALRYLLLEAGLDPALLTILDAATASVDQAIHAGVNKVVLTGHVETGRTILRLCAETMTPATMELSGCDAVFVLPGADLRRAAEALAFGLRLNGSATCMAPRRLFVSSSVADKLLELLRERLAGLPPVPLNSRCAEGLRELLTEAETCGAEVVEERDGAALRYALILNATPEMRAMETDIPAPLLSVLRFNNLDAAVEAHGACPYALSAAIFGPENAAARLAWRISAGTVLINDLIVPTADPRLAFGGRGQSGFGLTRGREGLLGMTAQKTVLLQRGRSLRPYAPTTQAHESFFAAFLQVAHGGWKARMRGMRALAQGARRVR